MEEVKNGGGGGGGRGCEACKAFFTLIPPGFSIHVVVRRLFCFIFSFSARRVLFSYARNMAEFIASLQLLMSWFNTQSVGI